MRITELQQREFDVPVDIMGDVILVTYYPHVITAQEAVEMQDASPEELTKDYLGLFCRMMKSWDVTEADGSMVELTTERLGSLPVELILTIMAAMQVDRQQRKEEGIRRTHKSITANSDINMDMRIARHSPLLHDAMEFCRQCTGNCSQCSLEGICGE